MKNWKTTIFGILGAIGVAILSEYDVNKDPRWLKYAAVIANAIGIAGIGWSAQDRKKLNNGNLDSGFYRVSKDKNFKDIFRKS